MTREEYRKTAYDVIYLAACVVNGDKPDAERVQAMDVQKLYTVAQKHMLTAIVCHALESVGIRDHDFTQAKAKAIQKVILLDAERNGIFQRLEQEGIWYMPLKGVILKEYYPSIGLRQMSDNDILFDPAFREKVRDIMVEQGFTVEKFGKGNHDVYHKLPSANFEMHVSLFASYQTDSLYNYYASVGEHLLKDEDGEYKRRFSNEDFYIYMVAHEYKHFSAGGTGMRSLLDTYVFLHRFTDTLNWEYIAEELKKLKILDFEQHNRDLANNLFSSKKLTEEETQWLDYYIFSGTYGNLENKVENTVKSYGDRNSFSTKLKYMADRVFPPMRVVEAAFPFFYRHKYLLPVLWVYRPILALIKKPNAVINEIRILFRKKRD